MNNCFKVKCIDNEETEHWLTIGKIYEAQKMFLGYHIIDDSKTSGVFATERFEIIKE